MSNAPTYSFVIPVHNEQEVLPELEQRLTSVMEQLDGPSEVLLVNDGSTDASYTLMLQLHERDPRFKVVDLSRNFGHQVAISVGLDYAAGDAVVLMDADLQDPPEVVLQMATRWREGYDIVYGIRDVRTTDTWFKRTSARAFYRMLARVSDIEMPPDVGDFRLVDRKVVAAMRRLPERARYLRGMFSWVGFKQTGIPYERAQRFAGSTKYPLTKMVRLATDALISFSGAPLRLALTVGFIFSIVSFLGGIAAIVVKSTGAFTVPGWTSLAVAVAFIGGIQLLVMGIVGEYIARIYEEVKHRPLYLVNEMHGIEPSERAALSETVALSGIAPANDDDS